MNKEDCLKQEALYRENVSLITFRKLPKLQFLLVNLREWPKDYWKFPQGGINPQESLGQAALREFQEELGTDKIRITSQSSIERKYLWLEPRIINGQKYIGQHQKFFIVEFWGEEGDVMVRDEEIRTYCWATPEDLESLIRRPQLDFEDYWQTIQNIFKEQNLPGDIL